MEKKRYVLLVALLLALALVVTGCGGEAANNETANNETGQSTEGTGEEKTTWELIQERGVLVAGLDDTFAPMGFREEGTNELVGFDIDMGEELAKRLGVKIQWQPTEWKGVLGSLNSKKFDVVISGMSITEERLKEIDFSIPYLNTGIGMVVKKGNTSIKTAEDLKDKRVATQTGSSGYKATQKLGLTNVVLYDQYPQAFQDLSLGRVDVIVVDLTTAAHYVTLKPGEYDILDERLVDDIYGIGIRKEDKDLKEAIDNALREMKKDGTLAAISKKWFGKDLTPEMD